MWECAVFPSEERKSPHQHSVASPPCCITLTQTGMSVAVSVSVHGCLLYDEYWGLLFTPQLGTKAQHTNASGMCESHVRIWVNCSVSYCYYILTDQMLNPSIFGLFGYEITYKGMCGINFFFCWYDFLISLQISRYETSILTICTQCWCRKSQCYYLCSDVLKIWWETSIFKPCCCILNTWYNIIIWLQTVQICT